MDISLLKRAAELLEKRDSRFLFFPVVDTEGLPALGKPYEASKPRNPEDIALILHPRAFDPDIDDDDILCDEGGEPIFWSFGKLA